jgi:hypothetical protein
MSAKIIDVIQPRTVAVRDMKYGQIGTFIYGREKVLVLRTFMGIVDLNHPRYTWEVSASHQIDLLPEGTRIELTAEAQE